MSKGNKIFVLLLGILFILTIGTYVFFECRGQEYTPKYFILLPLLYLFDGYFLSSMIEKQEKKGERISVKKLMMLRMIRIFASLVILLLGILLDKVHMFAFVVLFLIFYVVYLVFETVIMKNSQQQYKMKKNI